MVLVHHNSVVMLSTGISTSSRMLPVLSDTSVSSTDVPTLLPILPQTCSGRATPKNLPLKASCLSVGTHLWMEFSLQLCAS